MCHFSLIFSFVEGFCCKFVTAKKCEWAEMCQPLAAMITKEPSALPLHLLICLGGNQLKVFSILILNFVNITFHYLIVRISLFLLFMVSRVVDKIYASSSYWLHLSFCDLFCSFSVSVSWFRFFMHCRDFHSWWSGCRHLSILHLFWGEIQSLGGRRLWWELW